MRTFALFVTKISVFLKSIVGPHGQGERGLSQCGYCFGQDGGVNFSPFCADVLYGRPLSTKTVMTSTM